MDNLENQIYIHASQMIHFGGKAEHLANAY